jgi:hypothetical protein
MSTIPKIDMSAEVARLIAIYDKPGSEIIKNSLPSDRSWLSSILKAFSGVSRTAVYIAAVNSRPSTLPTTMIASTSIPDSDAARRTKTAAFGILPPFLEMHGDVFEEMMHEQIGREAMKEAQRNAALTEAWQAALDASRCETDKLKEHERW